MHLDSELQDEIVLLLDVMVSVPNQTGLTKGEGGVGEMLTMADKGERGGLDPPIFG